MSGLDSFRQDTLLAFDEKLSQIPEGKPKRGSNSSASISKLIARQTDLSELYRFAGDPEHSTFINCQKLRLHTFLWRATGDHAKAPRGVIAAFHGFEGHSRFSWLGKPMPPTEHAFAGLRGGGSRGKEWNEVQYVGSWVERFNLMGFHFIGLDAQGHGLSDGYQNLRCGIRHFDDMATDALQFCADVRKVYPFVPLFLIGCSMGAGVVARMLEMPDAVNFAIAGCVLLGSMISLDPLKKTEKYKSVAWMVKVASRLSPSVKMAGPQPNTVYPWMDAYVARDPLTYKGGLRARTMISFLDSCDTAMADAQLIGELRTVEHVFLLHNRGDTICDADGVRRFYESIGPMEHGSKKLLILNETTEEKVKSEGEKTSRDEEPDEDGLENVDVWHALVHDPDNEVVCDKVCAWLESKLQLCSAGELECPSPSATTITGEDSCDALDMVTSPGVVLSRERNMSTDSGRLAILLRSFYSGQKSPKGSDSGSSPMRCRSSTECSDVPFESSPAPRERSKTAEAGTLWRPPLPPGRRR